MDWRGIEDVDDPSVHELTQMLHSLRVAWAPPADASAWARQMLDLDESGPVQLSDITDATARVGDVLRRIEGAFERVRDTADEPWDDMEALQLRDAIDVALQRVHLCKTLLSVEAVLTSTAPVPQSLRSDTGAQQSTKKTPFQRTLLYVLDRLEFHRYRRVDDLCYREVYTEDGVASHAYEEVCSIMEFVQKACSKDNAPEQWDDLFASKCSIGDDIVKQLQRGVDHEFPELKPNRYLFSFRNGLYATDQHVFYAWAERDRWQRHAAELDGRALAYRAWP